MSSESIGNFKKNMLRLLTRATIKNEQKKTGSLLENVRKGKKQRSELIDRLTSEVIVVDEEKAAVLLALSEMLRRHFHRPDITLILLGSAGHGGSDVKKIIHSNEKTIDNEIDYALLTDEHISDSDAAQIQTFIQKSIKDVASRLGVSSPDTYRPCDFHNAEHMRKTNIDTPNIVAEQIAQAIDEAIPLVQANVLEYPEMLDEISEELVLYLQPSFPQETNHENTYKLLEALRMIYEYNPEYWEIMTDEILRQWKIIHKIKTKHITKKKPWSDTRTQDFVSTIEDSSSDAMSEPLKKLLYSSKE